MIYGALIIIRIQDGRVISVARNVQGLSVIVIDQDTNEETFPLNEFLDSVQLNKELDKLTL